MAGQIHVDYDKVTEIINKMYGGIFLVNPPRFSVVGRRDENGGLTAGMVKAMSSIPERGDAPHFLMCKLESNTAIMLRNMAEEMRAADEAASV